MTHPERQQAQIQLLSAHPDVSSGQSVAATTAATTAVSAASTATAATLVAAAAALVTAARSAVRAVSRRLQLQKPRKPLVSRVTGGYPEYFSVLTRF